MALSVPLSRLTSLTRRGSALVVRSSISYRMNRPISMKSTFVFGAVLMATFAFTLCAQSQTITAEYTDSQHGNTYGPYELAETFAANVPGNLFDVSLYLIHAPSDTSPMIVDFTTTSGGLPDIVLASATIQATQVPTSSNGFVSADFSWSSVQLTQGTLYAITVRESTPMPSVGVYNWGWGSTVGSAGEQALYSDSSHQWHTFDQPNITPTNFLFIARVQAVPEPTTLLLLLAGSVLFVPWPRRHTLTR
jgi:hypothetical protein